MYETLKPSKFLKLVAAICTRLQWTHIMGRKLRNWWWICKKFCINKETVDWEKELVIFLQRLKIFSEVTAITVRWKMGLHSFINAQKCWHSRKSPVKMAIFSRHGSFKSFNMWHKSDKNVIHCTIKWKYEVMLPANELSWVAVNNVPKLKKRTENLCKGKNIFCSTVYSHKITWLYQRCG